MIFDKITNLFHNPQTNNAPKSTVHNNCRIFAFNLKGLQSNMMKHSLYICLLMAVMAMAGCRQAKLSVADEQFARGEYYDASVTYKKVYNQLKKKEQRPERGMVAFRLGTCYKRLNMSVRAANA